MAETVAAVTAVLLPELARVGAAVRGGWGIVFFGVPPRNQGVL